jgi:glutathione synthase/RimK-type ligase-like ATP-grasp enzyme
MNIIPYKAGSQSAKLLSQALGVKRIKTEGSKFKGAAHKLVINWGCSKLPAELLKCHVLNAPENVSNASNKLYFFQAMAEAGVSIPRFTDDPQDVQGMLDNGTIVVARTILNGHSGAGIVLLEGDAEIVKAPLYVEYVPKKQEYRVHVFRGEVVDVQRKARRKDVPDDGVNWKVRNLANGFIFARGEDVLGEVPEDVLAQAKLTVEACNLDFGAVDVVFNDKQKKAYVLEVNTAPGLNGSTLDGYVQRFKEVGNGN